MQLWVRHIVQIGFLWHQTYDWFLAHPNILMQILDKSKVPIFVQNVDLSPSRNCVQNGWKKSHFRWIQLTYKLKIHIPEHFETKKKRLVLNWSTKIAVERQCSREKYSSYTWKCFQKWHEVQLVQPVIVCSKKSFQNAF